MSGRFICQEPQTQVRLFPVSTFALSLRMSYVLVLLLTPRPSLPSISLLPLGSSLLGCPFLFSPFTIHHFLRFLRCVHSGFRRLGVRDLRFAARLAPDKQGACASSLLHFVSAFLSLCLAFCPPVARRVAGFFSPVCFPFSFMWIVPSPRVYSSRSQPILFASVALPVFCSRTRSVVVAGCVRACQTGPLTRATTRALSRALRPWQL